MELSFETNALLDICEKKDSAKEYFKINDISLFQSAIKELGAAPNLEELKVFGELVLHPKDRGEYCTNNFKFKFIIGQRSIPMTKSNSIDASRIHRIKIIDIEVIDDE